MAAADTARLAVLIDADNATASVVKELLEEVAKYGTATVKRAYGDWTTQNLVGWKEHLHRHAIQPMQQFAYTKGKNSTDSAFIIDAMDLLYAGNVDGFCLVASDSDFTRLATRMREAGKLVYQYGWQMVRVEQKLREELFSEEITGRVRLGIPEDLATHYLPNPSERRAMWLV